MNPDSPSSTPGADGNPPIRRLADWDRSHLEALAGEYGTPLYVTDLARVRQNLQRIRRAFPAATIYYAAKANASRPVLSTVGAAGAGVECASAGEVIRARRAGVPTDRLLHTAVNPPAEDLDTVVEIASDAPGLTVAAGAIDTIDRLAARGYPGRLLVRIHPGVGAGHHETVATGGDAKFGIPADRATEAIERADERGLTVVGIHAHIGSGIDDESLDAHQEMVATLSRVAAESPVALDVVDVGGGFGVPYRPDEPPIDLEAVAGATRSALADTDANIVIEPGRYVVADAGVLLTRVNTVKSTDSETIVGVDAGMTTLLRPALYDAYHEIMSCSDSAAGTETAPVTVTGPICESSDVLATERPMPIPNRDDLLAIGNAGAYGYEMASQYNSRPRPATVVVDGERQAVERRRETIDDILALETEVPWL